MIKSIGCPPAVVISGEQYSKLSIIKGQGWKNIALPRVDALENKPIVGLYIRKQTEGEGVKKKTATFTDTPLLSNNALLSAYFNFKYEGCEHFVCVPVETFLVDCKTHSPGDFKPLVFPKGIDFQQSSLVINTDCLESAEECLMMHWLCTSMQALTQNGMCN